MLLIKPSSYFTEVPIVYYCQLLQERGWYHTLRQHIEAGRPYLGIGAGMHLLFDGTIDGECPGWAILPGNVEKLESWDCSVPHIGYGNVSLCPGRTALRGVNSQVCFLVPPFGHSHKHSLHVTIYKYAGVLCAHARYYAS